MDKKELRKKFLRKRHDFASRGWPYLELIANLKSFLAQRTITCCFSYRQVKGELDPKRVLSDFSSKMEFSYPRVEGNGIMNFYADIGQGWSENIYGIPEPLGEPEAKRMPDKNTLVITPCLAVDKLGYRLGYGGGFYDRYMDRYKETTYLVLTANEFLVEQLPAEAFDQKVSYVITETNVLETK